MLIPPRRTGRLIGLLCGLAALVPTPALAQVGSTPPPTMEPDAACPAVVTYAWDVRDPFYLTGVTWEFKARRFADPTGPDPARDAGEWVHQERGSVTVDLRGYGPVLDGSEYRFRTIGGNLLDTTLARPSETLVFSRSASLDGAYEAEAAAQGTGIDLDWDLPPEIAGCADRVEWEVRTAEGASGVVVERGVETGPGGSTTIDLSDHGPGEYLVRLAAFDGGTDPGDAVGFPGSGVPVSIAPPGPVTHRVAVTVVDEGAGSCAGAVAGAVVTAAGEDGAREATADADGVAVLDLPEGAYQITARGATGCPPATADVTVAGEESVTVGLTDCPYDLAVAFEAEGPLEREGGSEVDLPMRVVNLGPGAAPPGVRLSVGVHPPHSVEYRADLERICAGESRTIEFRDDVPGVPDGSVEYVADLSHPDGARDSDPDNDAGTLRIDVEPPADLAEADAAEPDDVAEPTSHRLTVVVEDSGSPAACPAIDAASVIFGRVGSPADAIVETGPDGVAVLDLAEGAWEIEARGPACGRTSDPVRVDLTRDREITLGVGECSDPSVEVAIERRGPRQVDSGTEIDLPVRVRNPGPAPSPAGAVALLRTDSPPDAQGARNVQVGASQDVPLDPLCPGAEAVVDFRDRPPDGTWVFAALWAPAQEGSNLVLTPEGLDAVAMDTLRIDVGEPSAAAPPSPPATPELHRLTITVEDLAASSCEADATVAGAWVGVSGEGESRTVDAGPDGVAELELPAGTYTLFPMSGECGEASAETVELTRDLEIAVGLPSCSRPYDLAVEIEREGPSLLTSPVEIDLPVRVGVVSGAIGPGKAVLLQRRPADSPDYEVLDVRELRAWCAGDAERVLFHDAPPVGTWDYRAFVRQDVDPSNSDDTTTITVRSPQARGELARPDLELEASQSVDRIVAGERVRYTIKVRNRGGAAAREILVEGVLSPDLELASSSATGGFVCESFRRRIRCTRDRLSEGSGTTVEIVAELPANTGPEREIRFRARTATGDQESDRENNAENLIATTAAPPPPAAPATQEYRVPAGRLLSYADRTGFLSRATRDLPGTSCTLKGRELRLSFVGRETGRCVYRFLVALDGRDLAPGWTRERVFVTFPREDGVEFDWPGDRTDPRFTITVEKTDPTATNYGWSGRIEFITLEGPVGRDWHEAFR